MRRRRETLVVIVVVAAALSLSLLAPVTKTRATPTATDPDATVTVTPLSETEVRVAWDGVAPFDLSKDETPLLPTQTRVWVPRDDDDDSHSDSNATTELRLMTSDELDQATATILTHKRHRNQTQWAVATWDATSQTLRGVFHTSDGAVHHVSFDAAARAHARRLLHDPTTPSHHRSLRNAQHTMNDFKDEYVLPPTSRRSSGLPRSNAVLGGKTAGRIPTRSPTPPPRLHTVEYETRTTGQAYTSSGDPVQFFPDCFDGDDRPNTLKISVAADPGFQRIAARSAPSTAPTTVRRAAIIREIQAVVAVSRVIYLAQLNVEIQLQDVVLASSASQPPVNADPAVPGTCDPSILNTLHTFAEWVVDANQPRAGAWHLLTGCYRVPGVVGMAYLGTLCDADFAASVSSSFATDDASYMWLTFAHEMGHVFGATHSFEFGVGRTGGIMDYGNGKVGSTVEFHPLKRPELCATLSRVVAGGTCGSLLTRQPNPTRCGNGLLEPGEMCECISPGSTRCGACVSCRLPASGAVQCSARDFLMRTPDMADVADVSSTSLSSSTCCVNGRFAPPKTTCTTSLGASGVCSANGACLRACSAFLFPGCGFDAAGCKQMCVFNGVCRDNLFTRGPPPLPVGQLVDGSACFLSPGNPRSLGVCDAGTCVPATSGPSPSSSSGSEDRTDAPTKSPAATSGDSCPPHSMVVRCAGLRASDAACRAGGCFWCGRPTNGACQATPSLCNGGTLPPSCATTPPSEPRVVRPTAKPRPPTPRPRRSHKRSGGGGIRKRGLVGLEA